MPRDGSNVFWQPAGTVAVPGANISSAAFNTVIGDIVADLNVARPVIAGGTGAANVTDARANLKILTFASPFAAVTGNFAEFPVPDAWARKITITFAQVTHTGTGAIVVIPGHAGGFALTDYASSAVTIDGATVATINSTTGLIVSQGASPLSISGTLTLERPYGTTWISSHAVSRGSGGAAFGGGKIDLGSPLTRIGVGLSATGAFTGGAINISWS